MHNRKDFLRVEPNGFRDMRTKAVRSILPLPQLK
jgi:hypothetical protein